MKLPFGIWTTMQNPLCHQLDLILLEKTLRREKSSYATHNFDRMKGFYFVLVMEFDIDFFINGKC